MARSRRKNRSPRSRPGHNLDASNLPFNAELALDHVPDPYNPALEKQITRSIRNDPLAGLYARGAIDQMQFAAGRLWQAAYETAGIGMIAAIDPLKEPVDGSGAMRTRFTDRQLEAFERLRDARRVLGWTGYAIVCEVLGEGLQIVDLARRRGYASQLMIKYFGARFRECLETLAHAWSAVA